MAALREILIAFGMTVDASPLDKAEGRVEGFLGKIQEVGAAIAGAFAVKKIWDFTQAQVELGDQLGDQAARLNVSTEALEQWQYAAQFAEISGQELVGMFEKVSRAAGSAAESGKKTLSGIDLKDAQGNVKTGVQLFEELGVKIASMKDGADRTGLALQYFGRSAGPKIIQLFKDGKGSIEAFRAEFDALGGGMGDFAQEAGEVDDQQKRLNFAWGVFKIKVAGEVLPAFSWVIDKSIKLAAYLNKLVEGTKIVQTALVVLAAVGGAKAALIIAQYAPIIGTFLLWAAAVAFVVLALEDIYGFFTGKNSLIGKAIDGLFGKGASDRVREWAGQVKDLIFDVGRHIRTIFTADLSTVWQKFQNLIAYLGDEFRTKVKELFGEIGGDVIAEMLSAVTEVIGLFAGAADQIRKLFQGIFEGIADGIAKLTDAGADDAARNAAFAKEHPGQAPDAADFDVSKKSWTERVTAFVTGFEAKDALPVRVPARGGDTNNNDNSTSAPVINQNISVAPGTPQAQAQALTAAAAKGASAALGAPNRAAGKALGRKGKPS